MTRKLSWLWLAMFLLLVSISTDATSKPQQLTKSKKIADLTHSAFGAIWIDSDFEDADLEYEVRAALNGGVNPNARMNTAKHCSFRQSKMNGLRLSVCF
jgi:hypothetical protein